ncbi:UDP-N-acetylmuramoyl-L-alanine--D-glutamate ligase [Williamsia sp. CHRR-6]|uniref:UDP-N-acetylmuramoyl-L-alanine--D-glutamate ligase n=1 Tax=Williamsia sp. CHRR-6 TaxID=2835871 RepID=UPI001BDB4B5C|nr:UDP-N-acetylmuramoyl-L-alanine--D-glutamate ligase [Williamsia sp. CHRR-6]MBT0565263.1 UDP-N-acetylmuramoyl-L-alanine--D-glutamate ligase [Williamsia sp. CHRR-6]
MTGARTLPELDGLVVLVAGAGTACSSTAVFLAQRGARVRVCDDRPGAGAVVRAAGIEVIGVAAAIESIAGTELLIVSPGFRPDSAVVAAARAAGTAVWGDVEFAWHVDRCGLLGPPRTWLVITGTNGKTTTTSMVEAILDASPRTGAACGNIGLPVLDALCREPRVEVLAVELSSFQLFWAPSVTPDAGVVLNIAEDHLEWHGSMAAYIEAKSGALRGPIGVIGADDPIAAGLSAGPQARTVRARLAEPGPGEIGTSDGMIVDRAFGSAPRSIVAIDMIVPPGPAGRADAIAAAALTLAIGIPAESVAAGLVAFVPGRHRGEVVAHRDGVLFVDDSKATNPHAAAVSIRAYRHIVWVGGGQLKGASVDDLFEEVADRLVAAVVIGVDRDVIAAALARHAPTIPIVTVFTGDDGAVNTAIGPSGPSDLTVPPVIGSDGGDPAAAVMATAVATAWQLAARASGAGATVEAVLLAPAAASLDMFDGYGARGDEFARGAVAIGAVSARAADRHVGENGTAPGNDPR